MAVTTQAKSNDPSPSDATQNPGRPHSAKIDPTAPAGSKNSLGAESVRDTRPATDDNVVEAMDEETPLTPASPNR